METMTTYSPRELGNIMWNMERLRKIAKTLHTLDENACNYGLSGRQETRKQNLMKKAEQHAQNLGLHAYHQSDPRGCSLYLVESATDDNYTNGYAVQF